MNHPAISGPDAIRIVLTGGPGGGKTTALDLFHREMGTRVVVVPEAASLLFAGGFPRSTREDVIQDIQTAIYHVQRSLENVQAERFPERILLCDRGTVDGQAYWPGSDRAQFFTAIGTTHEAELARYDAVIFFESAAVGGYSVDNGNPYRTESQEQALELDKRLREAWKSHPRFTLIPHTTSFLEKIRVGFEALRAAIADVENRRPKVPSKRIG